MLKIPTLSKICSDDRCRSYSSSDNHSESACITASPWLGPLIDSSGRWVSAWFSSLLGGKTATGAAGIVIHQSFKRPTNSSTPFLRNGNSTVNWSMRNAPTRNLYGTTHVVMPATISAMRTSFVDCNRIHERRFISLWLFSWTLKVYADWKARVQTN